MKSLKQHRAALEELQEKVEESLSEFSGRLEAALPHRRSSARTIALTAGWVAAGATIITLGLLAGREIKSRYTFKRRTPYDYYGHAGDSTDVDFVVGV